MFQSEEEERKAFKAWQAEQRRLYRIKQYMERPTIFDQAFGIIGLILFIGGCYFIGWLFATYMINA